MAGLTHPGPPGLGAVFICSNVFHSDMSRPLTVSQALCLSQGIHKDSFPPKSSQGPPAIQPMMRALPVPRTRGP